MHSVYLFDVIRYALRAYHGVVQTNRKNNNYITYKLKYPTLQSADTLFTVVAVSGDTAGSSNSTGCQVVPGLLRINQTSAASVPGMVTSSPAHSFTGKLPDCRLTGWAVIWCWDHHECRVTVAGSCVMSVPVSACGDGLCASHLPILLFLFLISFFGADVCVWWWC